MWKLNNNLHGFSYCKALVSVVQHASKKKHEEIINLREHSVKIGCLLRFFLFTYNFNDLTHTASYFLILGAKISRESKETNSYYQLY